MLRGRRQRHNLQEEPWLFQVTKKVPPTLRILLERQRSAARDTLRDGTLVRGSRQGRDAARPLSHGNTRRLRTGNQESGTIQTKLQRQAERRPTDRQNRHARTKEGLQCTQIRLLKNPLRRCPMGVRHARNVTVSSK